MELKVVNKVLETQVFKKLYNKQSYLIFRERLRFKCRYMDLFITFPLFAEGTIRQLAALIGHKVTALGKGKVL